MCMISLRSASLLLCLSACAAAAQDAAQAPVPTSAFFPFFRKGITFEKPEFKNDISARFVYAFSAAPSSEFALDVIGGEFRYARQVSKIHAFTASVGYALSATDAHYATMRQGGEEWRERYRFTRSRANLLLGYRCTLPLVERVSFFAEAAAGVDISAFAVNNKGNREESSHPVIGSFYKEEDNTHRSLGFAYAGSAGFSFTLHPQITLDVGYRYYGSTTEPHIRCRSCDTDASTKLSGRSMRWHEIFAGATFRF